MPKRTDSQRVLASLRTALTGLKAPLRLVLGCSGGPDSTALLLGLSSLQAELGLELYVVHVDHRLRPSSFEDGLFVVSLCNELEVPNEVVQVKVEAKGPSLMARARKARYEALLGVARRLSFGYVACGHTADDQAETVVSRLLLGAGLRGLSGMKPQRPLSNDVTLIRPLLQVPRAQIGALLADSGIEPLQDPSNTDLRFQRPRLRHQILPLLRKENPRLEEHLGTLAELLGADADFLDQMAETEAKALHKEDGSLSVSGLRRLPTPLASRVLLRTFGPLPAIHVKHMLTLCKTDQGTVSIDLPGNRRAERRYDSLVVQQSQSPLGKKSVLLTPPLPATGSYGGVTITLQEAPCPTDGVPLYPSQFPLTLRGVCPGDRIRLRGGTRKISDLLIDHKIPKTQRAEVALLVSCTGEVLAAYVPGKDFVAKPSPESNGDPEPLFFARRLRA